jgi:hypothetical protein
MRNPRNDPTPFGEFALQHAPDKACMLDTITENFRSVWNIVNSGECSAGRILMATSRLSFASPRAPDFTHSTRTQLGGDFVLAENRA